MGLTISRQFVRLMGGDICVTSIKDRGSTFDFNIPVTLVEPIEAKLQPINQGRVLKISSEQPAYKILIVDDRQENRDLIEQLLQTVGFVTFTANNGAEAIAVWQTWHPHLILMDMQMPVMDDYDAIRQIRAQESMKRKCAIIALTASAFEEQASILAAGCNDFVRKPFRESVLFAKIAAHSGVSYIYDQKAVVMANDRHATLDRLQPTSLQVIPAKWVTDLNQAALTVDGERISQQIA